ncbi:hypothetical protein EC957_000351 [Mortierella hygrophila]|uniref:Uncharacterized protein n=1 Tax=Mortierella hygrophila TaxID=979708 RepID=A0A9P6K3C6_9FUNG|nr:hypothetical protein EC957_000351 [Mortierella hygrophila]
MSQVPEIPEIPDYNKMYNTSSYSSSQPMSTTVDNSNGYGPLDHGHDMTSETTTHTNNTVNMTPFQAPASNSDQQCTSGSGSAGQGHRRSSIGNLFNKMIGVDNSQQIPMRKTVSQPANTNIDNRGRRRSSIARFLMPDSQSNDDSSPKLGRRRSSSLGYNTGGDEHKGPYADVSRSQAEYMDHLRETERSLHLTHNKDGLPLPKDNTKQTGGRRHSLAKILGFDKPPLAR